MAKEQLSTTDILRELEPTVEKELNIHLAMAKDWNPHDYIPWDEGRNFAHLGGEDWDPEQSRLGEVAQTAMVLNLLTEDNLPSYHRVIEKTFGPDGAWGTWVGRWTAEEARHGVALRDHLVVTRAVDPVALEQERMRHMTAGYHTDRSPLEGVAYVTFQELATRISHRNTGQVAGADGDHHAEALLQRIATDENLHMRFYRNVAKAAFGIAPNQMMQAVNKELQSFEMPGASLTDFNRRAMILARAGIYDLEQHVEDVVAPVLRYWNVEHREDLTGEGDKARTDLYASLEGLRKHIKESAERRAARKARLEAKGIADTTPVIDRSQSTSSNESLNA